MTRAFYNDNDPYVCAWLQNLMDAGEIAPGRIDDRDIEPGDLADYEQVHLFAGIAGWPLALQWAGWGDRPVWTASCPCPPFSQAGKRRTCPECESGLLVWCPRRTGFAMCADCGHAWHADERHLWPEVWRLMAGCGPSVCFGEQVAGAAALDWLTAVRASLEIVGFDFGVADLPASCVGAPHIRQRLFWVAHAEGERPERREVSRQIAGDGAERSSADDGVADARRGSAQHLGLDVHGEAPESGGEARQQRLRADAGHGSTDRRMALPDGRDARSEGLQRGGEHGLGPEDGSAGRIPYAQGREAGSGHNPQARQSDAGEGSRLGEPDRARPLAGHEAAEVARHGSAAVAASWMGDADEPRPQGRRWRPEQRASQQTPWEGSTFIPCADGKARPIEPSIQPLADGLPEAVDGLGPISRIGALRGAGNAIVPRVAAVFIAAFMEAAA